MAIWLKSSTLPTRRPSGIWSFTGCPHPHRTDPHAGRMTALLGPGSGGPGRLSLVASGRSRAAKLGAALARLTRTRLPVANPPRPRAPKPLLAEAAKRCQVARGFLGGPVYKGVRIPSGIRTRVIRVPGTGRLHRRPRSRSAARGFSDSARGVAAGRIVPFRGPRRRSGTGSPVRAGCTAQDTAHPS